MAPLDKGRVRFWKNMWGHCWKRQSQELKNYTSYFFHCYFLTFYFEIISSLQTGCKNSAKFPYSLHPISPHVIYDLPNCRKNNSENWEIKLVTILLAKLNNVFGFQCFLLTSFFCSGMIDGSILHLLIVVSPWSPSVWHLYSVFLSFMMSHFWRTLLSHFGEGPSIWVCLMFSHV